MDNIFQNEVVFSLSDNNKYIMDLICKIGKLSSDEFINMVITFYGKFVYQKLCEIALTDVPITKS